MDKLPVVLWVVALILAVAVCIICIVRSKLFTSGHPHVEPITWSIVIAQLVSVVMCMVPFVVGKSSWDSYSADMQSWYSQVAWPAGIVLLVLVVLELALMFVQAHRAMRTEVDEGLPTTRKES